MEGARRDVSTTLADCRVRPAADAAPARPCCCATCGQKEQAAWDQAWARPRGAVRRGDRGACARRGRAACRPRRSDAGAAAGAGVRRLRRPGPRAGRPAAAGEPAGDHASGRRALSRRPRAGRSRRRTTPRPAQPVLRAGAGRPEPAGAPAGVRAPAGARHGQRPPSGPRRWRPAHATSASGGWSCSPTARRRGRGRGGAGAGDAHAHATTCDRGGQAAHAPARQGRRRRSRRWTAAHEPLRQQAVAWLAAEYDKDAAAQEALRAGARLALPKVREAAALSSGDKKDAAAFDALVRLLARRPDDAAEQQASSSALVDARRPAHAGGLPRPPRERPGRDRPGRRACSIGRRPLPPAGDRRPAARPRWTGTSAVARASTPRPADVSGYDQPIDDPEDEDPDRTWEKEQHPRHDAVLARLMDRALRHGRRASCSATG